MKKLVIIGLLVLGLMVALTGTASAAKETISVVCSESGPVVLEIVETTNDNWSVARVVDNGTHFIPFAISGTVTMDGTVVETFSQTKNGHQNQEPKETCTFEQTFTEDGHTFVVEGQAEVIRRPK
jgi:hypothetical protein